MQGRYVLGGHRTGYFATEIISSGDVPNYNGRVGIFKDCEWGKI